MMGIDKPDNGHPDAWHFALTKYPPSAAGTTRSGVHDAAAPGASGGR
jgi:hypothetical protein